MRKVRAQGVAAPPPQAGLVARGRCGPGAAAPRRPVVPRSSFGGAGALSCNPSPTQSAPKPTQGPAPGPLAPPWGSSGSEPRQVVSGGDRWRRVTMATRGVLCGRTRLPESLTCRRAGRSCGRESSGRPAAGPRSAGSGWGGNARAAVWIRRRSSLRRASVHQIFSPPFVPSAPPRSAAAQPCLLQTAVVKRCRARFQPRAQPIAALPRGASGPRQWGGQAGACADRRVGWAGRVWRGEDPSGRTDSPQSLQGLVGPQKRAGAGIA